MKKTITTLFIVLFLGVFRLKTKIVIAVTISFTGFIFSKIFFSTLVG